MIKITGIHIPLDEESSCRGGCAYTGGYLVEEVARQTDLDVDYIESVQVIRRSIDARRKQNVHFVLSVAVQLTDRLFELDMQMKGAAHYEPYQPLEIPVLGGLKAADGSRGLADYATNPAAGPVAGAAYAQKDVRPVVVGTGPAGLFAALYLARAGAKPVVLERGSAVEQRAEDVRALNETGALNPQSNIQFGEGGAGTFSDGKLTTNIKSPFAEHVLQWFAEAGAPEEILWQAKPHIGSDLLPAVVSAMRNEILERGGTVLFNTQLTGLVFEDGQLAEIEYCTAGENAIPAQESLANLDPSSAPPTTRIPCRHLVLACGHSARDTFAMLQLSGVHLEQKPFSIGVRIEHEQHAINSAQWGSAASHPALEAADYKLSVHDCAGRSVYTFCMCPGGEVVCAASEEGGIATNGASPFARDGNFANSALLVNVVPADFEGSDNNSTDPLAGVRFQQAIEARAFQASLAAGGQAYAIPAQTVESFLQTDEPAPQTLPASSCARGVVPCSLRTILPAFVCDALAEALPQFDRQLAGFAAPQALLLAPETRSTSPVRIARNEQCQAWLENKSAQQGCGIFPAGEGAGYAGGIMSAACDGLRVATKLVHLLREETC